MKNLKKIFSSWKQIVGSSISNWMSPRTSWRQCTERRHHWRRGRSSWAWCLVWWRNDDRSLLYNSNVVQWYNWRSGKSEVRCWFILLRLLIRQHSLRTQSLIQVKESSCKIQNISVFKFNTPIQFQISPNSKYIAVHLQKKSIIVVYAYDNPEK